MIGKALRLAPAVILIAAFSWAAISVAVRSVAEAPPDVKVIRIGHWQLEGGVRDGFNQMGAEFAALPEVIKKYGKVRIVQDAIPEGIYGQWISTQMIAATAPDIVEVGLGLPGPIWLAYQSRYFYPLTDMANAPNPFNAGTDLAGMALKDTMGDGMRSGYQEELQEYTRVPLARFTSRVFYNRDLLKKLTGLSAPPRDFRSFTAVCEQISKAHDPTGQPYVPIASSKYHVGMWIGNLFDPLTYSAVFKADFNRDGFVGNDETFAAIRSGALSFDSKLVRAKYDGLKQMVRYFQAGFTGLTRDEAVFLFAQQRAVFICTGTWDAGSLIQQAEGKFTVGATIYPQPAQNDPEYGSLVFGPNFDPAGQGFPFGITRFSKHPGLARDFLLYLASRAGNARLNQIIGWIPATLGAPLPPLLAGFEPVNTGMYTALNTDLGGQTVVKSQQLVSLLQTDPSYKVDQFLTEFGQFYRSQGVADWEEAQRDWRRAITNNERSLAVMRGEALLRAADKPSDVSWIRYRDYLSHRQLFQDLGHVRQVRMVVNPDATVRAPYAYSPEALARIKADLSHSSATTGPTP